MKLDFYWHRYKYLPYEQELARREIVSLFGVVPEPEAGSHLTIDYEGDWECRAASTTYFREVVSQDGVCIKPDQANLEASANGHNTQLEMFAVSLPYRQSTRFSSHGLHEYRGKFNPQVVRAIGNLIGLRPGARVLDPFCGSGTSLVEAAHIGWNALGLDLNPLAVEIAKAKLAALRVTQSQLSYQTEEIRSALIKKLGAVSFEERFDEPMLTKIGGVNWRERLPSYDYLARWFTDSILVQISVILTVIDQLQLQDLQCIFRVLLSDMLRGVSMQDPRDLRIRRRKGFPPNAPLIHQYLQAIKHKMAPVLKAREVVGDFQACQDAVLQDVRSCASELAERGLFSGVLFDAAITSPPYATALPYIDTQRLSLVVLGLISASQIRDAERALTGNREINSRERRKTIEAISQNTAQLPSVSIELCRTLESAIDPEKDGFRRQNVPALVYSYLADMSSCFREVGRLLKSGGAFALVVGSNKTRLGGRQFLIDTPRLLEEIGEANGFTCSEAIELDTYQRYDLHQTNSIRSETLLIMKRL